MEEVRLHQVLIAEEWNRNDRKGNGEGRGEVLTTQLWHGSREARFKFQSKLDQAETGAAHAEAPVVGEDGTTKGHGRRILLHR
jgi:hypothetical protein